MMMSIVIQTFPLWAETMNSSLNRRFQRFLFSLLDSGLTESSSLVDGAGNILVHLRGVVEKGDTMLV